VRIDGLARWRSGLIAYGRMQAPGRGPAGELAAIFLSETGETWRTVPIEAGVATQDTSEIHGLAAGPSGAIVIGGTCCQAEGPGMWHSQSGDRWELAPPVPFVVGDGGAAAVRATAAGFVAVGGTLPGDAGIWTSADGREWAAAGSTGSGLGSGVINDVALVKGRWFAVGTDDDGGTYDGAFWESADGLSWRRLSTPGLFTGERDTTLERLYPTRDGVLLIGNDGPHEERVRCEQLAGRTASLAGGPPVTALSCGWGVETHWWSPDGRSWERLPPVVSVLADAPLPGPGPNEFRLITAGGPGLINLGEDRSGIVRLWTSRDGRAWEATGSGEGIQPTGQVSGIVVFGGQVWAVGEIRGPTAGGAFEAAVWTRPEP
jgi:hypothetical protein